MSCEERLNLLSERALLQEMLAGLSADAWMSRLGFESRIRDIAVSYTHLTLPTSDLV